MQNIPIYEALAQASAADGVDDCGSVFGYKVVARQTRRTVSHGHGKM